MAMCRVKERGEDGKYCKFVEEVGKRVRDNGMVECWMMEERGRERGREDGTVCKVNQRRRKG